MAEEMTHGPNPRMRKVWFYLIAVVLAGTLFLTLWIAGYGLSPQKRYHEEFAHRFALYLNQVEVRSTDAENKIKNDPEYQKLNATYKQLLEQEEAQAKGLKAKLDEANKQLAPVRTIFLNLRDPEHMHESYQEVEEKYNRLKQQSDDLTRQLNALTPAVLLNSYIGYRGFRSFAFLGGSSDNLLALDSDLAGMSFTSR